MNVKKLEKVIAELEAWQNQQRALSRSDNYKVEQAKKLLMEVWESNLSKELK